MSSRGVHYGYNTNIGCQGLKMEVKMSKKLILLFLVPILLIPLLSGCGGGYGPGGSYIVPYRDEHFTVKPGHATTITINMNSGAVFEGYLTVRGGNDDVRFYIEDSYGHIVLDKNRVQGRYDFYYTATSEGFHTIYMDNTFGWITSKEVYIHYRVR